jgi:hypothetical protein
VNLDLVQAKKGGGSRKTSKIPKNFIHTECLTSKFFKTELRMYQSRIKWNPEALTLEMRCGDLFFLGHRVVAIIEHGIKVSHAHTPRHLGARHRICPVPPSRDGRLMSHLRQAPSSSCIPMADALPLHHRDLERSIIHPLDGSVCRITSRFVIHHLHDGPLSATTVEHINDHARIRHPRVHRRCGPPGRQ